MTGKHLKRSTLVLLIITAVLALVSSQAFATQGGGNEDCPAGTIQIAKFEWKHGQYKPEGNTNGVSVTGNTQTATFSSTTYTIAAVVVKASHDAKIDVYNPAVTSGTFNNDGLFKPNGKPGPDISNVKFCRPEVVTPPTYNFYLKKSVEGDGDQTQVFTFQNTYNGAPQSDLTITGTGDIFLQGLSGGDYSFSENTLPFTWQLEDVACFPGTADVTYDANGVSFTLDGVNDPTECIFYNSQPKGGVAVTKEVDWNGFPVPSPAPEFNVCLTGVNTATNAQTFNQCEMLGHGETYTFTNLPLVGITYSLSEPGLDPMFTPSGLGAILLQEGENVSATVTNTRVAYSNLNLTSDCPAGTFRVTNPNPYPVSYTWDVAGTAISGSGTAQPGANFGAIVTGQPTGTVRLFVNGVQQAVKATKPQSQCVGGVTVTKLVDWNGFPPPSPAPEFNICLTGTSAASNTVAVPPAGYHQCVQLAHGESYTFTDLETDNISYSLSEPDLSAEFIATGLGPISVVKGQTTSATITNSYTPSTGTLTIQKNAEGGEDVTFNFTVSGPSVNTSFNVQGGGLYTFPDLKPGDYTVTEILTDDWDLTGITCSNATVTEIENGRVVTVAAGANATCTFTNVYTPPAVCVPNWQADLKHEMSYIIGVNGLTATATITNKSELCEYPVGFASYEKFNENIDDQTLFDSSTTIIKPGETITLTVTVPACASQLDLFYGDLITSFAGGARYGVRLLDALHINGTQYCNLCTDPNPARDLKHEQSKLIANDTGRIVNLSQTCAYEVGIASYQKFDAIVDHQSLFAYNDTVIQPGQTLELSVAIPECSAQVDLYYGRHLESLYNQRYGERLLDARHINGNNFCQRPPEMVCEPGTVGAMNLGASVSNDKLFVEASFSGNNPSHVVYTLGGMSWTERLSPYIFMGDNGWAFGDYEGVTNISVEAFYGALVCQTGSIDIAEYLTNGDDGGDDGGDPNDPTGLPPVVILPSQNLELMGMTRSGSMTVVLDASNSYDPEGKAITFMWHNGATTPTQQVVLGEGTHQVWVTVTDADGMASTGVATVTITGPNGNIAPVAVIDAETSVQANGSGFATVTLMGTSSFDVDGSIAGYAWSNGVMADTLVLDLPVGTHTITLTVVDDDGAVHTASVTIEVISAGDLDSVLEGGSQGPTEPTEAGKVDLGGGSDGPILPPKTESNY